MKAEAQLGQQQYGQPQQNMNPGYGGPQQIVVVNQTVIEPPCCGTLCVSINDFFWLWGPTGMGFFAARGYGGLAVVYILGIIAHLLALGSAICSCGLPSSGKIGYLTFYKWFRLAWFIIYLIGAIIIIILGIVIMGAASNSGSQAGNALGSAIGIIIIILGIIIAIPGIVMASTHGCFSRDLAIKRQAVGTGAPTY